MLSPARYVALLAATLSGLPALAIDTAAPVEAPAACIAHIDGIETVLNTGDPTDAAAGPDIGADETDTASDADPQIDTDTAHLAALQDLPACAPEDILRHLTPELADGDRAAFCLVRAETDDGTPTVAGFSEGARDDALTCSTASRFCERVNASRDAALDIAGLTEDADALDTAGAAVDGIRSLRERAGATILTGTGGAVASTLGSLGASALAAVTAPVAIAAGVVSVVAVGGAVYVCQ